MNTSEMVAKATETPKNDENSAVSAPAVENGAKLARSGEKYVVNRGDSPELLVEYSRDGVELLFDGRADFVPLTDEVVSLLSAENRAHFHAARTQNRLWQGRPDEDLVKRFVEEGQYSGSASQKLKGVETKLAHYWARPDMVPKYCSEGWRVGTKDEVKTFVTSHNGSITIGQRGTIELVLLVMPKDARARMMKAKADRATGTLTTLVAHGNEELERLQGGKRTFAGGGVTSSGDDD
jgi:hypothetical protein